MPLVRQTSKGQAELYAGVDYEAAGKLVARQPRGTLLTLVGAHLAW